VCPNTNRVCLIRFNAHLLAATVEWIQLSFGRIYGEIWMLVADAGTLLDVSRALLLGLPAPPPLVSAPPS
jgi:hypothetical protein